MGKVLRVANHHILIVIQPLLGTWYITDIRVSQHNFIKCLVSFYYYQVVATPRSGHLPDLILHEKVPSPHAACHKGTQLP